MPVGSWDHILSSKNTKLRFGNSTWEQFHDQLSRRTLCSSILPQQETFLWCFLTPKHGWLFAMHPSFIKQCSWTKEIAETHQNGWNSILKRNCQTHFETSESRRLCFNLCLEWCIEVFGSTRAHCEPEKTPICHKQEQYIQRSRRSVGCGLIDCGLTDRQLYASKTHPKRPKIPGKTTFGR